MKKPLFTQSERAVLRPAEVAVLLGCSSSTVRRWAAAPDSPLRPLQMPGQLRFAAADVRRLLEGRR